MGDSHFTQRDGEMPASVDFGPAGNFHKVTPALMALYLSSVMIIVY